MHIHKKTVYLYVKCQYFITILIFQVISDNSQRKEQAQLYYLRVKCSEWTSVIGCKYHFVLNKITYDITCQIRLGPCSHRHSIKMAYVPACSLI